MRLNGTYFDRLWFCILPYTITGVIIIHFANGSSLKIDLILLLSTTLFFWLLDSIFVYFKDLKTLRIDDFIYIGGEQISPNDVLTITPVTITLGRWDVNTIQFDIHKNDKVETILVMAKPMSFIQDIMGKNSKTLGILFSEYPELRKKLTVPF